MTVTGKEYMKASYYQNIPASPQSEGIPQPPLQIQPAQDAKTHPLPDPQTYTPKVNTFTDLVNNRRSQRNYTADSISLLELSYFLWMTQGVKRITNRPATYRTVPSAGARHAFETWLLINRVEGLEPGLYRYAAVEKNLIEVSLNANCNEILTHACCDQAQVANSAVTFIWAAILERMYWRYTERSMRYLHLDAGHVCQNLYLAAESAHCGVCAIAAFNDELINTAIGLDGSDHFVIYAASLGRKPE